MNLDKLPLLEGVSKKTEKKTLPFYIFSIAQEVCGKFSYVVVKII